MPSLRTLRLSLTGSLSLFCGSLICGICQAQPNSMAEATDAPTAKPDTPEAATPWNYTLGMRVRADDINQASRSAKLRPVLGLRYGRWRVGIGDGQEWLRFNSFRKEPSLSYQWIEKNDISLGLSMRIHNLNTNEGFDVFEPGRKTLRSRVLANVRITDRWSAGVEWTQDLLNRGDSSTLGLGVSYAWPLSNHSELSLSSGLTWAPAEHWRTAAGIHRIGAGGLTTGTGSVGSGLSYKHSLSRQWAWYSTLGINKEVGNVAKLSGPHSLVNGQIGLLYFDR
jgi:hypothetical protein